MAAPPDTLDAEIDEFIERIIDRINHSDSNELYKMTDGYGRNLLHIAIVFQNYRLFDVLISQQHFPFETKDNEGNTALETALLKHKYYSKDEHLEFPEHFALQLINKGVEIHHPLLLHCAVKLNFVQVIKLLLDKGCDVNETDAKGNTPLNVCFLHHQNVEAMLMLLCYGADPFLPNSDHDIPFASAIIMLVNCKNSRDQQHNYQDIYNLCENLFYYTFDEHGQYKISVLAFEVASELQLPFTERIIDQFIGQVTLFHNKVNDFYLSDLLHLNWKYLNVLIQRFPDTLKEMLMTETTDPVRSCDSNKDPYWKVPICTILNRIIKSEARFQLITYFSKMESHSLFYELNMSEACRTELICYLLSYGFCLNESVGFEYIYIFYGYCELFKICLHMDTEFVGPVDNVMVRLICDVRVDIQDFIDNVDNVLDDLYVYNGLEELLSHCAHPKLKQHFSHDTERLTRKASRLPKVPLLIELARNVFRRHFIQKCEIQSMKQFYDQLYFLQIPLIVKKIVAYEVPLYG